MDSRTSLFSFAVPAALVLAGAVLFFQGDKKPSGQEPAKPGEGAMQMPEMPKPTKEHEWLKGRAGTWDATVNMMGQTSKATEVNKMLGDFVLLSDFDGAFMGQPFKGHSVTTYDPMKKKYVSTWCDSTAPVLMVMEGTADASGKTLTLKGMGPDMQNKLVEYTFQTEVKGPDETTFTMFESSKGAASPMTMRIDYKRRK